MNPYIAGAGGAAGPVSFCTGAATCSSPPTQCDRICEDFEGSSDCGDGSHSVCRNTWTVVTYYGGTVDFDTPSGTYCSGTTNTKALKLYTVNASDKAFIASGDFGISPYIPAYIQFNFKYSVLGTGDRAILWMGCTDGGCGTRRGRVEATEIGGNVKLQMLYDKTSPEDTTLTGSTNLSADTWYQVRIKYLMDGNVEFWLDGVSQGSASDANTSLGIKVHAFGTIYATAGAMYTWIDNITFDDDTMASSCP
jgi:hypothetical protein